MVVGCELPICRTHNYSFIRNPYLIGHIAISSTDESSFVEPFAIEFECVSSIIIAFQYSFVFLLILEVLGCYGSGSVQGLINVRAVTQKLHRLSNKSREWILVSFSSSNNSRLKKVVESFFQTCTQDESSEGE